MFYTLDSYYSVKFYNQAKEALKNNLIKFSEFIDIKTPYNWYFKLPEESKPIMINYDELTKNRFLVRKVQALRPNEEYILQRRDDDSGSNIKIYIYNDAFRDVENYGIFFHIKSKDELIKISKEYPGKIYYLGKYYGNKFRVCLCSDKMIKNYISPTQILLEKTPEMKEPGRFEADFNYRVLKLKDFIIKFTETIYAENGSIIRPKVFDSTNSKTFI
jgi:hypothetical protein